MINWNYEPAKEFVNTIDNPITRQLTQLFLDEMIFFTIQKKGYPEVPIDLLFIVKAIANTCQHPKVIEMCLNGEDLDEGWKGVAEAFEEIRSRKRSQAVLQEQTEPHETQPV